MKAVTVTIWVSDEELAKLEEIRAYFQTVVPPPPGLPEQSTADAVVTSFFYGVNELWQAVRTEVEQCQTVSAA